MRVRSIVVASILLVSPATAFAKNHWDPSVEIGLSPQLGKNLPKGSDNDTLDDSSLSADFVLANQKAFGWLPVELRAGTTYEPELDNDDPTSSAYSKITFGDRFISLRRLTTADGQLADQVTDAIRPYLSVTGKLRYDDYLANFSRRELVLAAGFRLRDVRTIRDERKASDRVGAMRPAQGGHAYSNTAGVYYELRAEMSRTWSNNALKERLTPKARIDVYSRLMGPGIRAFGRVEFSVDYYDLPSEGSVGKRREKLATGTFGLDFTRLVANHPIVDDLGVSVQYQKNWSNALNQAYERIYIAPSLTLKF